MISTEKKIGRPTVRQAWMTISVVSPRDPLAAEVAGQVVRRVLGHDDRLVDQDADADRDPGQAHDVRRHAEEPHHQEAEQDRHRQRDRDDERVAEVPHHQQDGDRADDQLLLTVPLTVSIALWISGVRS